MVRNEIKKFSETGGLNGKNTLGFKLIIMDESDALSLQSQDALRRGIETNTANVRFIFICNQSSNLNTAIQSRCTRFRFGPLDRENMNKKLGEIIVSEGLSVRQDVIDTIISLGSGDMRNCINLLQVLIAMYDF